MKRVTGFGGVFFEAADPDALRAWYQRYLGVELNGWGGAELPAPGPVIWTVAQRGFSAPGVGGFVINYRVDDLKALVAALAAEGIPLAGAVEESEYGLFAWVLDPEGHKVELWQAPAGA